MKPQKEVKEEIVNALDHLKEVMEDLNIYEVNDGEVSVVWAESAERAAGIAAEHTYSGDDLDEEVTTKLLSLEEVLNRLPEPPEYGEHPVARLAAWLMDVHGEGEGLLWSTVY